MKDWAPEHGLGRQERHEHTVESGDQELSENQGKTFWGLKDEKVDSRWQCGERRFQQRKQHIRMWLKKTEFGKQ